MSSLNGISGRNRRSIKFLSLLTNAGIYSKPNIRTPPVMALSP